MIEIKEDRISKIDNSFIASCLCGKVSSFTTKDAALNMIGRGTCRYCTKHYRNINSSEINIYKVGDKWGKKCSGCNSEQLYTRKDHAKQSSLGGWQCKKCVASAKGFNENRPVGDKKRVYNRFSKVANDRGIVWELSVDEMYESYNGYCNMTGWEISIKYSNQTASLDRIDSSIGYVKGNIQWVHKMVNMCKQQNSQDKFIDMCVSIAKHIKNK